MTRHLLAGLLLLATATIARADDSSPVGTWRTIDDKTGKDRSMVVISESGGVYTGTVQKIITHLPDDDPNGLCRHCEGDRKDKPIEGMQILWGLKKDGDVYDGGEILDPKNGKIYSAKIKLVDGGQKLDVRGFLGISLLGRTQTWVRVP